jgi:sugar lactone lactonase YvrE
MVVNDAGQLIVSNFGGGGSLLVYSNAYATGDTAPVRLVAGSTSELEAPASLAIDLDRDLLFVGDTVANAILVFGNTVGSSFDEDIRPLRKIEIRGSDAFQPIGLHLTPEGDLYVAERVGQNVVVFEGAADLTGRVTPSRTFHSTDFEDIFDVFVDEDDVLYVVDSGGSIYIFEDASLRDGVEDQDRTLKVDVDDDENVFITSIVLDSEGTGYICDFVLNAIYSYDDIATLDGELEPDRTITGTSSRVDNPVKLRLLEN